MTAPSELPRAGPRPPPLSGVIAAYRLLLGRPPEPGDRMDFASRAELQHHIIELPEFREAGRGWKNGLPWPLGQVFTVPAANMLFCPIGKVACTFLKQAMVRASGHPAASLLVTNVHAMTDRVRTGLLLGDLPREEAVALMRAPGVDRAAVLRDPRDRLLSAWIEKFVLRRMNVPNQGHTRSVVAPVQAAQGRVTPDFDHGVTFREFVTYVTTVAPETLDPHWRPQSHYLKGMDYGLLYRLDALDDLLDLVEQRTGVSLPREPLNVTGSGQGEAYPGAMDLRPAQVANGPRIERESFFDDELEERVARGFVDDFALVAQARGPRAD